MDTSEKYRAYVEVTPQNKEYVGVIIVSPLGAENLYNEIQKRSRFNTKYIVL